MINSQETDLLENILTQNLKKLIQQFKSYDATKQNNCGFKELNYMYLCYLYINHI